MWARFPVAVFLVLHALVFSFLSPGSWLFEGGRGFYLTLGAVAAVALTAGAILFAARRGPWAALVALGALLSLVQLMLFFELALIVGVVVDVGILAVLVWPYGAAAPAPRPTAGHGAA